MPSRRDRPASVLVELEDATASRPPPIARGTRPRAIALGAAATVCVALVAGGVLGRDGDDASGLLHIPSSATVQWATELDTAVVSGVVASDDTVVAAVGWDTTLVGLDRGTGALRWRRRLPDGYVAQMAVTRDVLVAVSFETEPARAIAIDMRDGAELWTRSLEPDELVHAHRDGIVVEHATARGPTIELLDERRGRAVARVDGRFAGTQPDGVLRQHGGLVDVLDWRTLRTRSSVDLGDTRLWPGDRRAGPQVTVGADLLALSAFDGATTMYARRGGALSPRWDEPAWMASANLHGDHPVVLVRPAPVRSFEERGAILDARTGDRIWPAVDDLSPAQVVLGDDGFVAVDRAETAAGPVVTGHRLDGSRMWRITLAPYTEVMAVDGGVATIWTDIGSGATTLTLYA